MKVFALFLLVIVARSESADGQTNPLQGTILLSVDEPVREGARSSIELAANDSIGFPRYGGYGHTDYQLYEYANDDGVFDSSKGHNDLREMRPA